MTKQIQDALKMAIEALEFIKDGGFYTGEDDCIQACKAALKQPIFLDECIAKIDAEIERNGGAWIEQPAQEPVAWMDSEGRFRLDFRTEIVRSIAAVNKEIPLYTHPCALARTAPSCQECENLKHDLEGYMEACNALVNFHYYSEEKNKNQRNKEFVKLSDDEINKLANKYLELLPNGKIFHFDLFARAIEQASKEKNNGI